MNADMITTDAALADLCAALAGEAWFTLDTEFLRERTYRARLCLIQVATPAFVAVVDPLAGLDLKPFMHLLHSAPRKVLHAARQDLEVFYDIEPRVPAPIVDTQIAAALLGHDDQSGFATLVARIANITIDKAPQRTDWSKRPLTEAQLVYAADDARWLCPVYETLHEQLAAQGRLDWLAEECARLTEPALYASDPELAWRRLRGGDFSPVGQQVLRALAVWREREAQKRDLPRSWVVKDDVLYDIARLLPETTTALAAVTGLEEKARARHGATLLDIVHAGQQAEPLTLWTTVAPLTRPENLQVKALLERVRVLGQELSVAPALLATRRDMERLVRGADPADIFHGWRAPLVLPLCTPATV